MLELATSYGVTAVESVWNGPRLREVRDKLGVTQKAVADAIGSFQQNINRWEMAAESPSAQEPKYSSVLALAEYFGVSFDTFSEPVGTPIRFKRRPKKPADD